jgi:hypothetical protein
MTEQSFETLMVWQKSRQLMLDVHQKLLPLLPKEEKHSLAEQMRRASKSVWANIVELHCLLISCLAFFDGQGKKS